MTEEQAQDISKFYHANVLGNESLDNGITKLLIKDGYDLTEFVEIVKDFYSYCTEIEAPYEFILENESGKKSELFKINETEEDQWIKGE